MYKSMSCVFSVLEPNFCHLKQCTTSTTSTARPCQTWTSRCCRRCWWSGSTAPASPHWSSTSCARTSPASAWGPSPPPTGSSWWGTGTVTTWCRATHSSWTRRNHLLHSASLAHHFLTGGWCHGIWTNFLRSHFGFLNELKCPSIISIFIVNLICVFLPPLPYILLLSNNKVVLC